MSENQQNNEVNGISEESKEKYWCKLREKFISKGFIKAYAAKLKQLSEVFDKNNPEEAARATAYFDQYRVVIGIIESWEELYDMDKANPIDYSE